jgi:protein-S-isoprenylcysteine O-methyltransferase Ste14
MTHGELLFWTCVAAWTVWGVYWFAGAGATNRTRASEGWLGRVQHLLPSFVGFTLIFHGGRPWLHGSLFDSTWPRDVGAALTIGGLLFATWGRRHLGQYWSGIITLKEGHRLIRTGPYRFVRHPLYTGFLTAVLGTALVARTGDALIGFAIVLVAYLIKIRREESLLTREFGDEYARFRREVPMLVPWSITRTAGEPA